MVNIKLTVAYKGKNFYGWQFQPEKRTVEAELNKALSKIYKKEIKVIGAGRTDSGVHAEGQVANYKVAQEIDPDNLKEAINTLLAEDVNIKKVELVAEDFHARYSAKSREYVYFFSNKPVSLVRQDFVSIVKFGPDLSRIKEIEKILLGKHDFVCLRNTGSNEKQTVREILDFKIREISMSDLYGINEADKLFEIYIKADSYLYRMVRNIVGALFEIMRGKRTEADFKALLDEQREYKYTTALAKGLSLIRVNY